MYSTKASLCSIWHAMCEPFGCFEKGSSKYYIYNPDGEVFLESDRKVYLIKRDNKVCYTKVNKANKEVEVYSLSDGELISTLPYDFYTYYTYNQYDIMG